MLSDFLMNQPVCMILSVVSISAFFKGKDAFGKIWLMFLAENSEMPLKCRLLKNLALW